jgi:SnoaL-like domain
MTEGPLTSAESMRLRSLLERDAIRQVIQGYARGVDRGEEAPMRGAYWDDASDDHGPFKGSAQEFVTWSLSNAKKRSGKQHFLGQSVIEVDECRASAETYFLYFGEDGRAPLPNVVNALAGRYVDSLERRSEEWKIADRVVVVDWSMVWRSDERFAGIDTFVPGNWFPDDLIYKEPHRLA